LRDAVGWIAEDRDDAASVPVEVDERLAFDTVAAFPADGKTLVGFLDIDGLGVPLASQPGGQPVRRVEQPSIARIRREQCQGTDGDKAPLILGGTALDVTHLVGQAKLPAADLSLSGSVPDRFPAHHPSPHRSRVKFP